MKNSTLSILGSLLKSLFLKRWVLLLLIVGTTFSPASAIAEMAEEERVEEIKIHYEIRVGLSPGDAFPEDNATDWPTSVSETVEPHTADVSATILFLLLCEWIFYD